MNHRQHAINGPPANKTAHTAAQQIEIGMSGTIDTGQGGAHFRIFEVDTQTG